MSKIKTVAGRRGKADPASTESVSPAGSSDERTDRDALLDRIKKLEREVQECRQLNSRLADVVDVVTELLVPALDRDDVRVAEALARLLPS
jgi:hypothetical protein